ncbi:MAG: dihydroxy-acid dehydratase [Lachnospiraceae bacterium]|nr:dihydroxy-acid dehydratase [Lachnospiraceae bacterium]
MQYTNQYYYPYQSRIIIDIPNRTLTLCVPDDEIRRRLETEQHPVKERTPALARYAALVTSADKGAVLTCPETR